jgi:hypothetical protein
VTIKEAVQKGLRLKDAYARWQSSGKPNRSEDEIARIYTICESCDKFVEKKKGWGKCKLCGCRLNISGKLNKIKMATESCPDSPPQWVSDIIPPQIKSEQEAIVQEGNQDAREARKRARAERMARREARSKARETAPQEPTEGGGKDPLQVTDRYGTLIGHCLRDLWSPSAGFLVGGGPSLQDLDLSILQERGVVSMGINNVAGMAPVTAFVCGDIPDKFHHGIWFDPNILKFIPTKHLRRPIRAKIGNEFRMTQFRALDCPSLFGFHRSKVSRWNAANFLKTEDATWGLSKDAAKDGKSPILFSFFLGLRLMHYLGIRRLYLIGVDFHMDAEHGYAFPQYRWPSAIKSCNNHYRVAIPMLRELKPFFDEAGYQVFNCNETSGLDVFPYVPYEDAVEDCRGLVPAECLDLKSWYEKGKERDRSFT